MALPQPMDSPGTGDPVPGPEGTSALIERIIRAARGMGLLVTELSRIDRYPLLYVHSRERPVILVAGTFHGNEPGGVFGIVEWLESRKLPEVPIGFLPLVNPTGFERGTRENRWGENPNGGFWTDREPEPSREGITLLDTMEWYRPTDAFLTFHEAHDTTGFFQLTFEDTPSQFSSRVLVTGVAHFGLEERLWDFQGKYGSFEDYLYRDGLLHAVCTETPTQYPLSKRSACGADIIDAALEVYGPKGGPVP